MENVASMADCVMLARRLIEALERPFDVLDRQVELSGSVGIAVFPDHGQRGELVVHAEAAMYAAKRSGGGEQEGAVGPMLLCSIQSKQHTQDCRRTTAGPPARQNSTRDAQAVCRPGRRHSRACPVALDAARGQRDTDPARDEADARFSGARPADTPWRLP